MQITEVIYDTRLNAYQFKVTASSSPLEIEEEIVYLWEGRIGCGCGKYQCEHIRYVKGWFSSTPLNIVQDFIFRWTDFLPSDSEIIEIKTACGCEMPAPAKQPAPLPSPFSLIEL